MELDGSACWERLRAARRGVLGTVHATRGVDAVPVVFVVDGDRFVIPIDTVKPKRGTRLQRLQNLDADARSVLLVDHYDEDWSRLWWVRVHGSAREADPSPAVLQRFAAAFPAYGPSGSVTSVIVLTPQAITGWAAGPDDA